MERVPEPELMDDPAQARAYAAADFSEPHDRFVQLFGECFPGVAVGGPVLDLGCGPADIACRFARAHPACTVVGVDGSAAMLEEGRRLLVRQGLAGRITLHRVYLSAETPDPLVPGAPYETVICNSLLHHLADPMVLWTTLRRVAVPGARILVMDLLRPATPARARELVAAYAGEEPEILRRDFHRSLLAAYRPEEVWLQLQEAGLSQLAVQVVSDRHFIVHGQL